MTQLKIIFALIIFLISTFLCIQLLKLYSRFKRASDNATAKNIYVMKCDNDINDIDEAYFPETEAAVEPAAPRPEVSQGQERRIASRVEFQGFVDFINKGTLYKEQARDLSYSGIFIKSRTPEKYEKNEFIVLTFETDEDGPQRRNGRIARISRTGIGVRFVS